jgi:hypothetical protein
LKPLHAKGVDRGGVVLSLRAGERARDSKLEARYRVPQYQASYTLLPSTTAKLINLTLSLPDGLTLLRLDLLDLKLDASLGVSALLDLVLGVEVLGTELGLVFELTSASASLLVARDEQRREVVRGEQGGHEGRRAERESRVLVDVPGVDGLCAGRQGSDGN